MPKKKKTKKVKKSKKSKKLKYLNKTKSSLKVVEKKNTIPGPDEKPEIKKIKKHIHYISYLNHYILLPHDY